MENKGMIESAELLATLSDFSSKENWDRFFTLRGSGDAFEWYAEWPNLRVTLLSQLSSISTGGGGGGDDVSSPPPPPSLQVLVPGCGSSRLSEHLYDAGFRNVTNIDFSRVVISDMLRRNIRARPEMRWRVMDMTEMQFADGFFDAVLDKGGLDALMEPKLGSKLGSKYLKEVKRVLKLGGNYLCLTLAESHVLGLLFSEFRFGWNMTIHKIPCRPHERPNFQTYMVVVARKSSDVPLPIASLFEPPTLDFSTDQCGALVLAIEDENRTRNKFFSGVDILYSLEDLQLGAKGNLKEIIPGRRCQLILGGEENSRFSYKTVLLDSQKQTDKFLFLCGVFIVPKVRAHEWLFSSEEGQWVMVESSKAARLIMVFLDPSHNHASMDDIQKDLSPLVKNLAPENPDDEARIPFMMANDGVKHRTIVKQVTSTTTGPIIIEDVIYENLGGDDTSSTSLESMVFRRLTFERSLGLVQSEALLTQEEHSQSNVGEILRNKSSLSSRNRKRGSQRKNDSRRVIKGSRSNLKIDHSYLASSYHNGIVAGLVLIVSALENAASRGRLVKTMIIGLGAGLLPMCLHQCLPFLHIEAVELDPIMLDLAKDYFGFIEDKQLKVHISDGIQFIQNAHFVGSSNLTINCEKNISSEKHSQLPNGINTESRGNGKESTGIKILIVDADASDVSTGLTCPPAEFLEESFLLLARDFLSEGGLFVINLVSRSPTIREMVVSRMKVVFCHVFCLELEEDVNEVIFAFPTEACIPLDHFPEVTIRFQELLKFNEPERRQNIIETSKRIKCLK